MHVLCEVGKNIISQNKTLLVMFYRHNNTFWYQFCNFKHFLKAENSEDSLASSCVEFSIGLSCNPVWDSDWVTIGTNWSQCYEPTKNFMNFMFLNAWKLLKIVLKYPYLCLRLSTTTKCNFYLFFYFLFCFILFIYLFIYLFFCWPGTFSLEKWKSKWPTVVNMCFQKLWKKCGFTSQNIVSDVL